MADNVFVVSADPEGFEATVESAVAPDALEDVPGVQPGEEQRVWGFDDDEEELFDAMEPGDLVLFYRDGRYVGVGTVGQPFRDEAGVAEALWDDPSRDRLYTVVDFDPVDLSRAAVHAVFDYSANYYPSVPMRVPDDRVTNSLAAIAEAVRRYDREN